MAVTGYGWCQSCHAAAGTSCHYSSGRRRNSVHYGRPYLVQPTAVAVVRPATSLSPGYMWVQLLEWCLGQEAV